MDAKLKTDHGKVIVEGKTAVPFKTFVGLIIQRKVFHLFTDWGKEAVIVSSELLTDLASSPQDNRENREGVLVVTLCIGILIGVFLLAVIQIALEPLGLEFTQEHLFMIAGTILGVGILGYALSKLKKPKTSNAISEMMERIAGVVGK